MGLGRLRRRLRRRRSRSTRSGGWRRSSPALGAAVGEAVVPVIRAFIGEDHVFDRPLRGRRRAWSPSAAAVLSPLLVPVGRWCMRVKQPEWKAPREDESCDARSTRHPRAARRSRLVAMAADKRAARLGVLALVATLLFGAIGARLWFLQTVQAESLQQTVDARKTKTVRLVPERGRIFDADGPHPRRQPAVLTVSVDWDVHPPRHRPRRALHAACRAGSSVPVDDDGGALRRQALQPLPAAAAEGGRRRERRASRSTSAVEDFPGVAVDRGLEAGVPVRPAGQPRPRLHGRDHRRRRAALRGLGYDTSLDGEEVGRSGVELSMETVLHGKWGEVIYEVDADNRIVREISYEAPVNGDGRPAVDRPRAAAVRRTAAADPAAAQAASSRRRTPRCSSPDGVTRGPLDEPRRSAHEVPYKAPAGSVVVDEPPDRRRSSAMASYPTFDNRWFSADVAAAKFDEIFPTTDPDGGPSSTPTSRRSTNRAIQGQYNMGSTFKLVHRLRRARPPAASAADTTLQRPGHVQAERSIERRRQVRQRGRAVRVPQLDVPADNGRRAGTARSTYDSARPCRATRSSTSSARSSTSRPARSCRTRSSCSGSAPTPASTCRSSSTGGCRRTSSRRSSSRTACWPRTRRRTLQPGDLLQLAIGQGLLAATPLQLAVGYSTFANGGRVLTPHVVQAILAPETPDGDRRASPT